MKVQKKYCVTCGTLYTPKVVVAYYDETTGKPQTHTKANCPNKKWYQLFHGVRLCLDHGLPRKYGR